MIIFILALCAIALVISLVSFGASLYSVLWKYHINSRQRKGTALLNDIHTTMYGEILPPISCFAGGGDTFEAHRELLQNDRKFGTFPHWWSFSSLKKTASYNGSSPDSHASQSSFSHYSDTIWRQYSSSCEDLIPTMDRLGVDSWHKSAIELGLADSMEQEQMNLFGREQLKSEKLVKHYLNLYYTRKAELGQSTRTDSRKKIHHSRLSHSCMDLVEKVNTAIVEDPLFTDELSTSQNEPHYLPSNVEHDERTYFQDSVEQNTETVAEIPPPKLTTSTSLTACGYFSQSDSFSPVNYDESTTSWLSPPALMASTQGEGEDKLSAYSSHRVTPDREAQGITNYRPLSDCSLTVG
jgi:hypothetical protein